MIHFLLFLVLYCYVLSYFWQQQHNGKWRYTAEEVKILNRQGHSSRSQVASNVFIFSLTLSSSKFVRDMCFFSHEYRRDVCFFVFLRDICIFSHAHRRQVCLITYLCNIPSCCLSVDLSIFFVRSKLNKWTKNSQVSKIELINLIWQTTH